MVWKKIFIFSSLMIIILIISACETSNQSTLTPKKVKIGVSMATMENETFQIMKEAMYDSETRDNVKLIWKDAQHSERKQLKDIKEILEEKVDIIILHLENTENSKEICQAIKEENIPVIALSRLPNDSQIEGYITNDNFQTGVLQAKYVVEQIDYSGKVMILKGDKTHNIAHEITAGNMSVLNQKPGIKIVVEKWHQHWAADEAEKTTRKALEKYPDINAIIANNSKMILAAVKVLKEKKLTDKVITVGADADKEALIAIGKEEHDAEIDIMPYIMGRTSFKTAVLISRGEKWLYDQKVKNGEYSIPVKKTPVNLIDKYNVELLEKRWGSLEKYKKGS